MSNQDLRALHRRDRLNAGRAYRPKDRGMYLLLLLLLGHVGAHNFYAERLAPAFGQLALGVVTWAAFVAGSNIALAVGGVLALWLLWDAITVEP